MKWEKENKKRTNQRARDHAKNFQLEKDNLESKERETHYCDLQVFFE